MNMNEENKGYNYMHARGVEEFPYFVGVRNLKEIATKEDRICVINILGGESRTVTPVSHVFSGGNIVCGTMPGRSGEAMKTAIGDIPVYNNILEALDAGHKFNVAVIYVPPSGVKDSVIEAVRVNPDLKKVVILTEKVPVKDSRIIRHYCQWRGVDVFGGNCLGVADAHNRVRIGGALGGSAPEESLVPGSIAIFSNSGNFTTTIAVYLLTAGWGSTLSISSGKDLYIHYSAPEFTYAFHNDDRSKAAVMYIEPGGYYEHDLEFKKPVVCCVVGRWKAKLTRSCGHAGAIAGAGDNAFEKEKWFLKKFGVDGLYSPESPICSAKGAVVTNIAHIPAALSAVMKLNGVEPDFPPQGDLSLKCWFGNDQGLNLPDQLKPPVVEALEPYNEQIEGLSKQLGTIFPRQNMKDCSGASRMDPKTQVSQIHGVSILDASTKAFEENLVQALIRRYPRENGRKLANVILNAFVSQRGTAALDAAEAAREAGSSPNVVLASAIATIGPKTVQPARDTMQALFDLFGLSGLEDPEHVEFDYSSQLEQALNGPAKDILVTEKGGRRSKEILAGFEARGAQSLFVKFLQELAEKAAGQLSDDVLLGAVCTHLSWRALQRKRLALTTMLNFPWHMRIFSAMVGCAVAKAQQEDKKAFYGIPTAELTQSWSFTETAFLALLGRRPNEEELFAFQVLLGLIITNGPGTISAQGAKGAVSADGPEVPDRVQVNKAYIGFLTHTGFAHGGNGYEAIAFLAEQFKETGLSAANDPNHGLDLTDIATRYAKQYKAYKVKAKADGDINYAKIPCVNHPVFKGKDVNYDPREVFVDELFKKRGDYNVFQEFYHQLVHALFKTGVSREVYCVNVDAVIAVILLKILWGPYQAGEIADNAMESSAFTTFLFGRMIGSAAEIDDHTNRGRNMDTRTAASLLTFAG